MAPKLGIWLLGKYSNSLNWIPPAPISSKIFFLPIEGVNLCCKPRSGMLRIWRIQRHTEIDWSFKKCFRVYILEKNKNKKKVNLNIDLKWLHSELILSLQNRLGADENDFNHWMLYRIQFSDTNEQELDCSKDGHVNCAKLLK